MAQSNVVRLQHRRKPVTSRGVLPIKSVYYLLKEVTKRNSSSNPLRCVSRCVEHLRLNSYEATHAEVFDEKTGTLHAVVKRDVNGNVHVLYERKIQKSEVM